MSVSRGKERLVVYTDDKTTLRDAVAESDDRLSATELVNAKSRLAVAPCCILCPTPAFARLRLDSAVPLQAIGQVAAWCRHDIEGVPRPLALRIILLSQTNTDNPVLPRLWLYSVYADIKNGGKVWRSLSQVGDSSARATT